ncbi:MAG: SpoIVB peptidase [Clostridia bacterium]|nr:SpoIVB peptidase [Clostridia bacterium]
MKFFNITIKVVFFIFLIVSVAIFTTIYTLSNDFSKSYKITKDDTFDIDAPLPVTAEYKGVKISQSATSRTVGEKIKVDLKMFGLIPISTVDVEVVDEMYVSVLGNPFGMKIYTEGVLVINFTDFETKSGIENPAKKAGIQKGDYILSVNGKEITTNEELSDYVAESNGKTLRFKIKRGKNNLYINVKPVIADETNSYKIGLWVRDSSAGIGTLTFYSPLTGVVCGLGQGICDSDTGDLLSIESGEFVNAEIISVTKGKEGSPGEMHGKFLYETIADISLNSEIGVYGALKGSLNVSKVLEVALKQEIKNGNAKIYCTVDGENPKFYNCTVKKRSSAYFSRTQNLIVEITDKELLEKTGGIIQGMSGSPILQNGKLIGAVTHVLVDDPTKGYGIFAENMLETAQSVSQQQQKDAS